MKKQLLQIGSALLVISAVMIMGTARAQQGESSLDVGVAVSAEVCAPAMTQLWTQATSACINKPEGFACNGGTAPQIEPDGPVENAMAARGSLVGVGEIDAIQTVPIDVATGQVGIAYLRLDSPISASLLALGETILRDVAPPDFSAWQSMIVQTSTQFVTCGAAPLSVVILQAPVGGSSRVVINGASLSFNGTILVHTTDTNSIFVGLSGLASLTTFGQEAVFYSGQQVSIGHDQGDFSRPTGPASPPIPYDAVLTRHLPVSLFDRPLVLPQPGTVVTQGDVNLRADADIYSGVITQIASGEILSVLGRTTDGQWYNVRRVSGETGWMSSNLLLRSNLGAIEAIYQATPIAPQRYGELGTQGRIVAASGVNMRVGPDVVFPAIITITGGTTVNLIARSPYSPWVKIESGGVEGWVALVNIETQAFIDALAIDFGAPPIPPPTAIPGSFGNAFPDPAGEGN